MSGLPATEHDSTSGLRERLSQAMKAVNEILLGKDNQVELAFACLLDTGRPRPLEGRGRPLPV